MIVPSFSHQYDDGLLSLRPCSLQRQRLCFQHVESAVSLPVPLYALLLHRIEDQHKRPRKQHRKNATLSKSVNAKPLVGPANLIWLFDGVVAHQVASGPLYRPKERAGTSERASVLLFTTVASRAFDFLSLYAPVRGPVPATISGRL